MLVGQCAFVHIFWKRPGCGLIGACALIRKYTVIAAKLFLKDVYCVEKCASLFSMSVLYMSYHCCVQIKSASRYSVF